MAIVGSVFACRIFGLLSKYHVAQTEITLIFRNVKKAAESNKEFVVLTSYNPFSFVEGA